MRRMTVTTWLAWFATAALLAGCAGGTDGAGGTTPIQTNTDSGAGGSDSGDLDAGATSSSSGGENDTTSSSGGTSSGGTPGDAASSGGTSSGADSGGTSSGASSGASSSSSSGGDDGGVSSSGGGEDAGSTSSSSGGEDAGSSTSSGSSGGGEDAGSSGSSGSSGASSSSGGGDKTCTIGMGAPTVDCGAGNYCKLKQPNTCSGVGTCQPKPQGCAAVYQPVCGCDGKTYGNACNAAGAGQNAKSSGTCGTTNPCATKKCGDTNPCTDNHCNPKTGACEFPPSKKGTACNDNNNCTLKDMCDGAGQCIGSKDPNCGGNPGCCQSDKECKGGVCAGSGKTAVCKDTSKLLKGECWTDAQCGTGTCKGANICPCGAQCIVADKPGKCDGGGGGGPKTCTVGPNAPANQCAGTEYCKLPAGQCTGSGTCTVKPNACTKEYAPMCGCDGKTHGNTCMAAAAGQNIKQKGACPGGNPCATIKCGDGNACTADTCDPSTGKCEFPPLPKGQPCSDGDACTLNDQCDGGGKCTAGAKDPNCGNPPPKPGCCFTDKDCKSGTCITGGGKQGVCKDNSNLQKGECWSTGDCGGNKCIGASICPCGAACFAPDKPGKCDNPPAPNPGCCNTDKDCKATEVCFEGPFKAFKCMPLTILKQGQCWTDAQCGKGSTCTGAMGCGCKAFCKALDKPGTCTKPIDLCANVKCDDNNKCTADVCNPLTGKCVFTPIPGCNNQPGCCKSDKDCKVAEVCVNGQLGFGKCKSTANVPNGSCWTDAQCNNGKCVGAIACACNALCKVPDAMGKCLNAPPAGCVVGKGPCAAGQFCAGPVGACGKTGACVPVGPGICPMIYKPVCGCDGKTYSNSCVAVAKGMSLASDGACGP